MVYCVGVTPSESATPASIVFANNLKAARGAAGMTQEEFARKMTRHGFKWHQATVYKVENGERTVRVDEADAAAQILRVPLQQLMLEQADAPFRAAEAARLRELHWVLSDARTDLVEAVYRYGIARRELAEALEDSDPSWLVPARYEQIRREVQAAAIRDWADVRAADAQTTTRNPSFEDGVIESET